MVPHTPLGTTQDQTPLVMVNPFKIYVDLWVCSITSLNILLASYLNFEFNMVGISIVEWV